MVADGAREVGDGEGPRKCGQKLEEGCAGRGR